MKTEILHTSDHHCCCGTHHFKRISWTAIVVGAIVGLGLGFLLNLFGFAIGLSAFTTTDNGSYILAIGGLIGLLIAVIASMLAAGYAAGYLGRLYCPKRNLGILYGFTTWCLMLLLSAAVATHVTNYATTYSNNMLGSKVMVEQNAVGKKAISVSTSPAVTKKNQSTHTVTTNVSTLTTGAFILFVAFFIGAIFTCLGACWGMACKRDE